MTDNTQEKSIEVLESDLVAAQGALDEAKKKAVKEDDTDVDDDDKEDKKDDEVEVDVKADDEKDAKVENKKAAKKRLTQSYREEDQPEPITVKVKEGVAALFDGQNLSEEFKTKAEVIVGGILTLKINEEVEKIEAAAQKALEETVTEIETDMLNKVDEYHDYVANEFIAENKLAIESGLKMEIYESFFEGLRGLFLEHNIAVPDAELNLLEKTQGELEEANAKINSLTEKVMEADKKILELHKNEVVLGLSEGLAATQVEKFKTLTCDIEAKDLDSFKEKAKIIRESFFKEESKDVAPKLDESPADIDPGVKAYLEGARRFI